MPSILYTNKSESRNTWWNEFFKFIIKNIYFNYTYFYKQPVYKQGSSIEKE